MLFNRNFLFLLCHLWSSAQLPKFFDSFRTAAKSIKAHYLSILNFFINRSTNASAESFNAKIKVFR
ncbi:transposase [Pedobacter sp. WC2501]|uniref:transposase n=1 Tax=Pedobacter sp. WC2501 TaxID=3461400 RepID=UPI0040455034